jgi:hypothetical protein
MVRYLYSIDDCPAPHNTMIRKRRVPCISPSLMMLCVPQSLRTVALFAARLPKPVLTRRGLYVPALGTEEEMKAQAIEQIRARVRYQKEVLAAKHAHNDEEEMWRWLNITFYVALPICALSCFYSFFFDEHPHRHEDPLPEYMVIRSKEFPWECGECDLFDLKCWKKCRAEKAA